MNTWRKQAKEVINLVLLQTRGQSAEEINKALYDAYPFGLRKRYPYKVWLEEIKHQRLMRRILSPDKGDGADQEKLF